MPAYSVIVPVYLNEANIAALVERLAQLNNDVAGGIEAVCVVDGSPDASYALLRAAFERAPFASQLLLHSRNFGSFAAIRSGLGVANGKYFAVMAADLQEPASLLMAFFSRLAKEDIDVVLGTREARDDHMLDKFAARLFWGSYRRLVQSDLPSGGVDVFGCNRVFRDHLLSFTEANSSLVGQLVWLGFRQAQIPYRRVAREAGKSAWTFRRKLKYLADSAYSFTDLPIRIFTFLGAAGIVIAMALTAVLIFAKATGMIQVPGYTATVLTILFFSSLNLLGLGIIGAYVWRTYENTKSRPLALVMKTESFAPSVQGKKT
jgi:polyisoprenyl-phosphate glycosyltransferase